MIGINSLHDVADARHRQVEIERLAKRLFNAACDSDGVYHGYSDFDTLPAHVHGHFLWMANSLEESEHLVIVMLPTAEEARKTALAQPPRKGQG